nr:MAG TPA: hypothetical protein [Herelleviridae sp.]
MTYPINLWTSLIYQLKSPCLIRLISIYLTSIHHTNIYISIHIPIYTYTILTGKFKNRLIRAQIVGKSKKFFSIFRKGGTLAI